jgi:hypothetical protein
LARWTQERDQAEDARGKDRKPDGQDSQGAWHVSAMPAGTSATRRYGTFHSCVCGQQRTNEEHDQDSGERLLTLLTDQPRIQDRDPGTQGNRLDGAPRTGIDGIYDPSPGRGRGLRVTAPPLVAMAP